jgi:hypothetical protein
MREIGKDHDLIRQYLLGRLTDEEQERLEKRFMTDGEYREEVLIVEEELIEDYLDDSLSTEDKGRVDSHFLSTPQQMQRLGVAKALDRYTANLPVASAEVSPNKLEDSLPARPTTASRTSFVKKRVVVYALAAVVLIGALAGVWSLFSRWRQPDFGHEFALVNGPEGKNRIPDRVVTLFPGTLRGGESLKVSPDGREQMVELNLALGPGRYNSYRVIIRGGNLSGQYSIDNLRPTISNAGTFVPVRIPTSHLASGDYSLELVGLTSEGAFEGVADYSFRIAN